MTTCRKGGCRKTLRSGFSLTEVCLSLGILAFALVAVMSLLSTGAGNLSRTLDSERTSQVQRQILAEVRQQAYSANAQTYHYYFTAEGTAVAEGTPGVVFRADVTVKPAAALPGGGASDTAPLSTVTVAVYRAPGGNPVGAAVAQSVSVVSCREMASASQS